MGIKKDAPEDKILQVFWGSYVTILLQPEIEQTISTPGAKESVRQPLAIQGYFLDADDSFYYLGMDVNVINQAVNKLQVIHISEAEVPSPEKTIEEEILESMEGNPKKSEMN